MCGSAGRRCLAGWPRGTSRLPLAASPHLTGWLLASLLPSRPSLRPCCAAACSACLPACRCGAADCRRPRAPAARPVPGRSPAWSRLARARCAAAGCRAPDARYGWMDSGSLDWDRVELPICPTGLQSLVGPEIRKKNWAAEPRAMARVARGLPPPLSTWIGSGRLTLLVGPPVVVASAFARLAS